MSVGHLTLEEGEGEGEGSCRQHNKANALPVRSHVVHYETQSSFRHVPWQHFSMIVGYLIRAPTTEKLRPYLWVSLSVDSGDKKAMTSRLLNNTGLFCRI